jgi:hypothetical protein
MSKSNVFESKILRHILLNEAIAGLGDANGLPASATPGSVYVRLHKVALGEADAGNASEADYTGYASQAIARSAAGFTEANGTASNVADITFPLCTAAGHDVTGWSLNTAAIGAGIVLYKGSTLGFDGNAATIGVAINGKPVISAGSMTISED